MKTHKLAILLLTSLIFISACTTIVDRTTSRSIEIDPGKRSFGTYLNDQQLEIISRVNINKAHPDLKLAHINVTSFNNNILLTGQVPTDALRVLAEQTVFNIHNVRNVHNELQIKGNTAFLVRTNDTWLASKMKSVFIADSNIQSNKVKIIVEDGVVYLLGILTQIEADYITSIASNIAGIEEVVKVFEYLK